MLKHGWPSLVLVEGHLWQSVYSIGAILYHLVTGRAPFAAGSLEETLNQVLHQDPISVRLLNRRSPRDLDTICLKCLENAELAD